MKETTFKYHGKNVKVKTIEKGDIKPVHFREFEDDPLMVMMETRDTLPKEFLEKFKPAHNVAVFRNGLKQWVQAFNERFHSTYNTIVIHRCDGGVDVLDVNFEVA